MLRIVLAFYRKIKTYCYCDKRINENSPNNILYETLTPKIVTDARVQPYFDALNFAFNHNDVKNIAITGSYGAGKSTIIRSYLESKYKKKYVNVSLADFDMLEKNDKKSSEENDNKSPDKTEIELSILQQILFTENKDNLPDSRIDRIQNRNCKHILSLFLSALSFVAPLFFIIIMIFLPKITYEFDLEDYFPSNSSWLYSNRFFLLIGFLLIALIFIVRIATKVGIFDKKLKLSKIAFLQGSADVSTQETPSLLNNCLDEIVYFFLVQNAK